MSAHGQARARARGWAARMSVGTLLAATIGVLLALAVLGVGLALVANGELTHNRRLLLDDVGPSVRNALELESALVNEETGVRGYVITAQRSFLQPYDMGLAAEARTIAKLRSRERVLGAGFASDIEAVRANVSTWHERFVTVALEEGQRTAPRSLSTDVEGKHLFDAIRASLSRAQRTLTSRDDATRRALNDAANTLLVALVFAGALILLGIAGAGFVLRRTISRPLARLGVEARRVGAGEFDTALAVASGPREIVEMGSEIDAMRMRIVAELASVEAARVQVEEQAAELRRSNAELEQFAYVASHDLQEPLRKITSFCQALQSRYGGQLDERADQYIDFAVDGAKRMQALINDLLAFSRVGRGSEHEPVALDAALAQAQSALADSLSAAGASVEAAALPAVRGDLALLASLFQNLIANAVKFRSDAPPVVRIAAERRDDDWELSVADNGIGIEPEYAERIFLIFQRLHSREAYDGSGIGLALARKIVEYHGGHIWLDTRYTQGACFRLTLPIAEETNR